VRPRDVSPRRGAIAHEQVVLDRVLRRHGAGFLRAQQAEIWSRRRAGRRGAARAADGAGRPAAGPGSGYSRIRLTGECTLERRAFIGLTDEDIAELRTLRGLIERETPAVLDEFYEFLSGVPEMAALVPPATALRLKQQVASYWLELVEGDFGRTHAASRMRIGVMHEKIGVGPQWYLAGLARQLAGFLRVLAAERPGAIVRARLCAYVFSRSSSAPYIDARATTLMRTEGYANQLVAGLASAVAVIDGRDRLLSANRTLLSMIGGDPAVLFLMPVDSAIPIPEAGRMLKALRDGGEARLVGAGKLGTRSLRITAMTLSGHPGGEGNRGAGGGRPDRPAAHLERPGEQDRSLRAPGRQCRRGALGNGRGVVDDHRDQPCGDRAHRLPRPVPARTARRVAGTHRRTGPRQVPVVRAGAEAR
jgi:hypothetical protein